ncbi:MAG TPA: hypothetical protein VN719_13070 [Gemmatimonadales bacterium]|nr:hypothetical protein [Gemmatimonadales bacterium]
MTVIKGDNTVTGPFSARPSDPGSPPPGRPSAPENMPDPWGVRRAENLLTSLEGILSARVVTTPLGEVSEIHILAQSGLAPKQIVRNIESALLAQLGLKVDHRKISIAQTAEVRPLEAVEDAVRERALHRAVLFENLQVSPGRRPHRIMITVTLSFRGQRESADEESSDTPRSRVEAAAKAAVTVLDRLMTDHSVALEGAKIVDAFDREFAFIAVQGLGGRETLLLTGSSQIKESAERAAVFAVLDATNRWTDARRPT